MQARPVKAASGSDLARLTAIGNLGMNGRPAGFGQLADVRERRVGGITARRPETNVECEDEFSGSERGGLVRRRKATLPDSAGPHTDEGGSSTYCRLAWPL